MIRWSCNPWCPPECYPAPAGPIVGLATEDTLSLLRAWKAERDSSKPTSSGVKTHTSHPNPHAAPQEGSPQPTQLHKPQRLGSRVDFRPACYGAGQGGAAHRRRFLVHTDTLGILFFDRDLDPVHGRRSTKEVPHAVAALARRSGPGVNGRRDNSVGTLLMPC